MPSAGIEKTKYVKYLINQFFKRRRNMLCLYKKNGKNREILQKEGQACCLTLFLLILYIIKIII